MAKLKRSAERVLVVCSLWLHIGFIGACGSAAGLVLLFDGEATSPWALALVFFGSALAATGWRRGLTVLERDEWASTVATNAPREMTSPISLKQTGQDAIAMLSSNLLQSNRRCHDGPRRSTSG